MAERWSTETFAERLKATIRERYHDSHPFHQRMHAGSLTEDEVKHWIYNRFYYQRNLPAKDALIVAKLPDREARRRWLERIVEQDGRTADEGGLEDWLRLGQAAGLGRKAMLDDGRTVPGVRFAVDGYVSFCRENSWWEGVAASLTQLQVPELMDTRISAFEQHYRWVKTEGLAYFRRRRDVEPGHADHALSLVLEAADTRERQERALAAVRYKCDVLNGLLDALDQR
jgi:pyrroloquinoline-quinone synthase